MTNMMLVRFHLPEQGVRTGVQIGGTVHDVTETIGPVGRWLRQSAGRVEAAIAGLDDAVADAATLPAGSLEQGAAPGGPHWLPPVDDQDIWAAGVTYERSRVARQEEAVDGGDVYSRVYVAARPELFFKARGPWVVGPHEQVGIRSDASWNVPEPELALVINPALEIVGFTAANDMSSRDIEGENPLYLPQAKMYTRSCALGPGIVLSPLSTAWPDTQIRLQITREGEVVFAGQTHTGQIRRRPAELVEYLGRCLAFPDGAVLLTGTGIVPPESFTLAPGDHIQIEIDAVGVLSNVVTVV